METLNNLPKPNFLACDQNLISDIARIPDQLAFKIGDVAELVGVKQYVLRYWETEFEALRPKKSRNGQRTYSRRDIETALIIRYLLYSHRYSIEGARSVLSGVKREVTEQVNWKQARDHFERARNQLVDLVNDIRRAQSRFL